MLLRVLKPWLTWCVLFAALRTTSAIFEEQLGEFDWKRENIGIIDSSFVFRDQLVVATSDGVLACLNSETGGTTWRVVLPQHSKILKFVEVDGHLVTLVSQPQTATLREPVASVTVRGWSVVDGSLLWDTFLGTTNSSADSVVDLMYVGSNKQLTVLFDNALHIMPLSSKALTSSPAYWSWSAETDLAGAVTIPALSTKHVGHTLTLALSSLIAPTYSPDHANPSSTGAVATTRTAVGCFVRGAASKDVVCEGELVLVKVNGAAVALEVLPLSALVPKGHTVRVGDLTAVVSSDATLPYEAGDVLFAATRSENNEGVKGHQVSLAVLSLDLRQQQQQQQQEQEQEQAVHFPLKTPISTQDPVVKSFTFVDTDGELRPAVSACTTSTSSSSTSSSSCQSFVAYSPSSSTSTRNSKWSLRSLLDGAADCEREKEGQDGGDVRLQYGSVPFYDRVVHTVTCASVRVAVTGSAATGRHLHSVALKTSGSSSRSSNSSDHVVLDLAPLQVLLPPSSPSSFSSAVHHMLLLPVKPSSSGKNKCVEHSLLVVLHSGHTMVLSAPSSCTSDSVTAAVVQVLWERFEGLARAQQAVVMDRAETTTAVALGAGQSSEDEGDSPRRMPSFTERLQLQRAKLLNAVNGGADTLLSTVDFVKAAVQRLTGGAKGSSSNNKGRKRRDLNKLQSFGFDKIAAVLCYSDELASYMSNPGGSLMRSGGVPFSQTGLQVAFLDLLRSPDSSSSGGGSKEDNEVRSLRYLSLDSNEGGEEEVVTFVKLLPGVAPTRRLTTTSGSSSSTTDADTATAAAAVHDASSSKGVLVVLGTASGRTYFWDLSPSASHSAATAADKVCSLDGSCTNPSQQKKGTAGKVSLESYSVRTDLSMTASVTGGAPLAVAATGAHSHPVYTILHAPSAGSSADMALVTVVHDKHAHVDSTSAPFYVHSVDKESGRFTVYKTSTNSADREACASLYYTPNNAHQHYSHPHLGLSCVPVRAAASAFFDPLHERIVEVTYPSAQDAVHVPYSILGDDSVLLKYLNPHVALVTSITTASATITDKDSSNVESNATTAGTASGEDSGNAEGGEDSSSTLYWTLVDTVTGKVIIRLHQESAALPVHAILLENHIVATYWNAKAKRTELSSTALYEGVIDNTELTPFASSRARSNSAFLAASAASASSKVRSAYSAVPPIAMQKTYTLPRAVSALHHTVTAHGLSNKNLLLGLRNGQVYSVDMKQVHPRRPFSDPSVAEKTEGLVRYSPFVTLSPLSALTHNYSLPGGVSRIVSSASNLESSSLVLSFGGAALDMHLNRVMPSQDFDLLSSDFNYSLLVTILLALATAVLFLRNLQQRKHLGAIWA